MIEIARPTIGLDEAEAAARVIQSGWLTQGPRVLEFENAFSKRIGARHACAVSNCTTALHMALLSIGTRPGDVVITVSHSFIATANAIRHCSAEPVFVDIDPETYNMSPALLRKFLEEQCERRGDTLFFRDVRSVIQGDSPLASYEAKDPSRLGRVAGILLVHQLGMPADLGKILDISKQWRLPLIEDAACAIGSKVALDPNRGAWQEVGYPHGDVACFSFHPRKVLTTGEGGLISTNDQNKDAFFRLYRQHGMSLSDLARHQSKEITFEAYSIMGHNYRMTDIQGAIGSVQLTRLDAIIHERRRQAKIYSAELGALGCVVLPFEPAYARSNWQSFAVRILDSAPMSRNQLMQELRDAQISTRPGVMNAHLEKPYRNAVWRLAESERARNEVMILPLYVGLTDDQLQHIVTEMKRRLN